MKRGIDVLNSFSFWFQKPRQFDRRSNQPLQKISRQLNSDINAVAQDWLPVEQLAALPIPEAVLYQCQLVVSEACTNAVHHAHKNLPRSTPIDLEITVFNERLEIKIWDWGEPFDFQAKLKKNGHKKVCISRY